MNLETLLEDLEGIRIGTSWVLSKLSIKSTYWIRLFLHIRAVSHNNEIQLVETQIFSAVLVGNVT